MKQQIAPKMVSGEWAGTMCLTEPGCGTDLRLMKTRAVEQPDGTYKMTGTKIFISGGDHDLTDNIIHMVIAKIPDENGQIHDDLSTVNFFMVPKFIVEAGRQDGRAQRRHAPAASKRRWASRRRRPAVLNFDDAIAWRLGPKPTPAQARREAFGERRHGGHVRHDERRAPRRRHAGHLDRRSRLPERLSTMRMSAASATR